MNEPNPPASAEAPEAASQSPQNQEETAPPAESEATPSDASVMTAEPPEPPSPPPPTTSGTPGMRWPLLVLLVVVPAVIVGAIVFVLRGNSSNNGGGGGAGLVEGFLRLELGSDQKLTPFGDKAPSKFPGDFPVFNNAPIAASFEIDGSDQASYVVAYNVSAPVIDVYNYYLDALDKDPWQVDVSRNSEDFTGIQFSRPDNADIQGSVTINHSDLDNSTSIFVIVADTSQGAIASPSGDYTPPSSRALPPDFPTDIPVYQGNDQSVVTDTYFQRDPGTNSFLVTFVTKDADQDIVDYYKKEFSDRGWNVSDAPPTAGDFSLTIQFDDGNTQDLQGTIRADALADDPSYTEVTLFLQVSATRGRGN